MKTEQRYEIIDNVKGISKLPDKSIDLTVTSPPYDNLRTYNGCSFNFELLAKELYRVTKNGGVLVWVVGDQTIEGDESGTSFRQALFFKEIGFKLFDTMIYIKNNCPMRGSLDGYNQVFEYMFVLSKGKPKNINLLFDRKNDSAGRISITSHRKVDGTLETQNHVKISDMGRRYNVWSYYNGKNVTSTDNYGLQHPAIFPEELAKDHILSWSNEGDWVLDPFLGSGTTLKMCMETNRNGIGFEINEGYENIIKERLKLNHLKLDAFNTST